jgi:hypothetical protein
MDELQRHLNAIEDIEAKIQELYVELADEQEEARKLYIELGKEYHLIEKKPKLLKKPKAKKSPTDSINQESYPISSAPTY